MAKNRVIAAIELGSSKISTVIAQVQTDMATFDKSVNITGVAQAPSKGVRKGQIVDIEDAVEATITSVEGAERMAGYNLESAYIALGGGHISSQNSQGVVAVSDPDGEIKPDDVDRVVEAASAISLPSSRELIHVLPREYKVDGEEGVKDPIGMTGVRLEVQTHLVTASQPAVKNLKKAVKEVGIEIEELVFSGLASARAVLTPTEKELGCVLIDIGGGTTSVAAFIDGAITYSGVIPIGARNVTNDLAIGLRVSLDTAEKVKLVLSGEDIKKADRDSADTIDLEKLGVTENKRASKKTLVEGIIRPRLNEIFTMVKLELEKAGVANRIPSGAILTGGGAETVGVIDSAKRMLSMTARIGKPKGVNGLIDDIIVPAFATPVGLILYGAEQEDIETLTGFAKKIKFPTGGFAGKIFGIVKDLLP